MLSAVHYPIFTYSLTCLPYVYLTIIRVGNGLYFSPSYLAHKLLIFITILHVLWHAVS